jgi:lipid-A-disaccharide synthase
MDALKQNTPSIPKEIPKNKRIIALLPGSRKPEVEKMLPPMLEVAALHPDWIFVIAVAPNFELGYFKKFQTSNVIALKDNTYNILSASNAAIVTSGTATLETALLRVPQMVCYKLSPLTYWVGKQVVKVKYISLVNLILDKPAVKELVQEDCNTLAINTELQRIMSTEGLVQIQSDYVELNKTIGNIKASEVVAQRILA